MTAMSGRATTDQEDIRVCSTRVRPLHVEMPASVGRLAELSAASLGWSGSVLPPIKLLGRYVVPVAELVPEAHAERLLLELARLARQRETGGPAQPGRA